MEWLNRIKSKAARERVAEEELYELAYEELNSGKRRSGLWAKALAKSGGSDEKAKSLYIELLVQKYKDQTHLRVEAIRETLRQYSEERKEPASKFDLENERDDKSPEMWKPAVSGDAVLWVVVGFIVLVFILAAMF